MPDLSQQTVTVKVEQQGSQATLWENVTLAKELPAKLAATSSLPLLRAVRRRLSCRRLCRVPVSGGEGLTLLGAGS